MIILHYKGIPFLRNRQILNKLANAILRICYYLKKIDLLSFFIPISI